MTKSEKDHSPSAVSRRCLVRVNFIGHGARVRVRVRVRVTRRATVRVRIRASVKANTTPHGGVKGMPMLMLRPCLQPRLAILQLGLGLEEVFVFDSKSEN